MNLLKARMLRQIALSGPIPLPDYWTQCLFDPEYGYYTTSYPIGAKGDFITAPEISQVFGELIASWWLATVQQNKIDSVALVEIGPGRGTLMSDMLRTLGKLDPTLKETLAVHMVEISPRLTSLQREKLSGSGFGIQWHQTIDTLPELRLGIVANELFDAVPIRAFFKHEDKWFENVVGARQSGNLTLEAVPASLDLSILPARHGDQPNGAVFEYAPARESLMQSIAALFVKNGGFGLFVDYGHIKSSFGDTLQAVRNHAYAKPLENPGESDLTSHVDFEALANAARRSGAHVSPVMDQGTFLKVIGIVERMQRLSKDRPDQHNTLETACDRLTAINQMGGLFKVLGIKAAGMSLPVLDDNR